MERDILEGIIERAVDHFAEVIRDTVGTRLDFLESRYSEEIKGLYQRIHDVRSGTSVTPGLSGHTLSIRELQMKQDQIRVDHDKLAKTVEAFVDGLQQLKSDNRLLAYRVAVVTGILVFIANVIVRYVKIF